MSLPAQIPDDRELIRHCGTGDRQAFAELAARYQAPLFRYLRLAVSDISQAEDLLQETLLAAWRQAAQFRGEASVKTWLYVIARNLAFHARRRTVLRAETELPEEDLGIAAGWGSASPEAAVLLAQRRHCLRAALDSLPESDREILVLRDMEGIDGEETARILGVSLPAMKTRLHRARLRLMAAIRQGGCE